MLLNQAASPAVFDLDEDERWRAIERIVDSPHFSKSPRLSRLLLYLAEQTLRESGAQLSEQIIAVRVFDRDASFNPAVDTIVRSHMVRLRQKLERYAANEGAASLLQVKIPKGEYLVRFEQMAPARWEVVSSYEAEQAEVHSPAQIARSVSPHVILNWVLGVLLVVSGAALVKLLRQSPSHVSASVQAPHPLWSRLFQPHQSTTFVAADSGLVLFHRMTAKSTTLAEYLTRDFSAETRGLSAQRSAEVLDMADRRYTSFVDMNLFRGIEHLPAAAGGLELKYARDLHMDDLKHGNFIFSGARGANPWLELYEPEMNFLGASDGPHHSYHFINRHPAEGEASEFSVAEDGANRRVLGVLAFLSNVDGDGNVLIVEGDSMAGTEAISDFVFNDAALLPFLAKIRKPDGSLSHFEVLLESSSVNGSAGPFHILSYRTHS